MRFLLEFIELVMLTLILVVLSAITYTLNTLWPLNLSEEKWFKNSS